MRTSSINGGENNRTDFEKDGVSANNNCNSPGKIYVVGLGPGNIEQMSHRAYQVVKEAEVIIGYKTYIKLITQLVSDNQEIISSGMTKEIDRCNLALQKALAGQNVCLVSSGDPGVYGMAGIMLEVVKGNGLLGQIEVETVPGITAANAAAAVLGAPLMHDYVVISLSDLLTPWETIAKRVELAAQGDFVIVLYNPKSKGRVKQIELVREILLQEKPENTPVGIVTNAKREGETFVISDLKNFTSEEINMFSVVIIGNSQTFSFENHMITPRGYKV
ncbi:MAG: precorrin-3B C(17)-methyltransferase [Bacillota bacterium]|nr:precorrin-3B C(17)-methyltransferase [Bacillota bacterium]